jgi:hypothetical protein
MVLEKQSGQNKHSSQYLKLSINSEIIENGFRIVKDYLSCSLPTVVSSRAGIVHAKTTIYNRPATTVCVVI